MHSCLTEGSRAATMLQKGASSPFVISRKNFLFCKTPSGAKATATVFSLIETAKANDLDPFKYLVYIFEKLSQDEDYDLEQLMPWTESVVSACKAAACE